MSLRYARPAGALRTMRTTNPAASTRIAETVFRAAVVALLVAVSGAVLLAGCAVRQKVTLEEDGSGVATVLIDVGPVLESYFRDLAFGLGSDEQDFAIFDPRAIRQSVTERPGLELLNIVHPRTGRIELTLKFDSLESVLAVEPGEVGRLAQLEEEGDTTTFSLTVNREAVRAAMALSPMYEAQAVEMVLPPPDGSMSREEYVEYLAWAFEEYEQDQPIRRDIRGAEITLTLTVPGDIESQNGGKVLSRNAVRFVVPVVELLTLERELHYTVTFR